MKKGVEELREEMQKHQRRVCVMIENGATEVNVHKLLIIHNNIINELELIIELSEQIKERR